MIGKILPHRESFGGITQYALYGRHGDNPERVAWIAMRNLEGVDPAVAHRVMEATSKLSRRVQKPRGHMIVSWAHQDRVSPEEMVAIMDQAMADLGLEGHQAMYVAHNDTEHQHVHAIINRVHPDTGRVAKDGFERLKLRRSLMALEQSYGLEQTPYRSRGEHNLQLFSEIELAKREQRQTLCRMPKQQCDTLRASLKHTFTRSNGWRDLESYLRTKGYQLQAAGPGVRLVKGSLYAKLSDVLPPKLKAKELIQRWGKFSDYIQVKQQREQEWQIERARRLKTQSEIIYDPLPAPIPKPQPRACRPQEPQRSKVTYVQKPPSSEHQEPDREERQKPKRRRRQRQRQL